MALSKLPYLAAAVSTGLALVALLIRSYRRAVWAPNPAASASYCPDCLREWVAAQPGRQTLEIIPIGKPVPCGRAHHLVTVRVPIR